MLPILVSSTTKKVRDILAAIFTAISCEVIASALCVTKREGVVESSLCYFFLLFTNFDGEGRCRQPHPRRYVESAQQRSEAAVLGALRMATAVNRWSPRCRIHLAGEPSGTASASFYSSPQYRGTECQKAQTPQAVNAAETPLCKQSPGPRVARPAWFTSPFVIVRTRNDRDCF